MKSLKALLLCVVLLSALSGVAAQSPEWLWATSAGGAGYEAAHSSAIDGSGNTYLTGYFEGTASFGATTLTSSGEVEIYVAKLDSGGNWLWAKSAGGPANDEGRAIAVDGAGNVYLTGYYNGTAAFGSVSLTSSGLADIFVAKLDTAGNWLWAKQAGSADSDLGYGITVDGAGNVYLTGNFGYQNGESVSFGGIGLSSNGQSDVFVAKLDTAGTWIWAKGAGGTGNDYCRGITLDSVGNLYLIGYFVETAYFGSNSLTSAGGEDIFIAKLSVGGTWLGAQSAGGLGDDRGTSIAADGDENIYLSGFFWGSADFGSIPVTGNGDWDIFVAKMDGIGNWIWAKPAGGPANDYGRSVALDSAANVYVTGYFGSGDANFGSYTLTSAGASDIFVVKFNRYGEWIWATRAGGINDDYGGCITLDSSANAYLVGDFGSTASGGSVSFGSITLTNSGRRDIFVAKLSATVGASDPLNPPAIANTLSASPNPFKQGTTLSIALQKPVASDLRVSLYDIKGRKVRTLPPEPSGRETFTLAWDGSDDDGTPCPNGIYLVKLFAGKRQLSTTKVTLIR